MALSSRCFRAFAASVLLGVALASPAAPKETGKDDSTESPPVEEGPFESRMLAYGALDAVAGRLVTHLCTAHSGKRIVVMDAASQSMAQEFQSFAQTVDALRAHYLSMLPPNNAAGLLSSKISTSLEVIRGGTGRLLSDLKAELRGLDLQLRQDTAKVPITASRIAALNGRLGDLATLWSDPEFGPGGANLSLALGHANQKALAVVGQVGQGSTPAGQDLSDAIQAADDATASLDAAPIDWPTLLPILDVSKTEHAAQGIRISDRTLSIAVLQHRPSGCALDLALAAPKAAGSNPWLVATTIRKLEALRDLAIPTVASRASDPGRELLSSLSAGLGRADPATGLTGAARIVRGANIAATLEGGFPLVLSVATAGGTKRTRTNLLTLLTTGDWIDYSGGVVIEYMLLDPGASRGTRGVLDAGVLRFRTGFSVISKPSSHCGDQGDNLDDAFGVRPCRAP